MGGLRSGSGRRVPGHRPQRCLVDLLWCSPGSWPPIKSVNTPDRMRYARSRLAPRRPSASKRTENDMMQKVSTHHSSSLRFAWRAFPITATAPRANGTAPRSAQHYKLGAQDQVAMKVYEWRPSRDEIYEWTAFKAEYVVSGSGFLSLPLLGDVPANGMTTAELSTRPGRASEGSYGSCRQPRRDRRGRALPAVLHRRRCREAWRISLSPRPQRARGLCHRRRAAARISGPA